MIAHVFSSLRARVILLVLLAALPATGLAVYAGLQQRRLEARQAQNEALELTENVASGQTALIEATHGLLVALAQLPPVREHDPKACSDPFASFLQQHPTYDNLAAIDLGGDVFCSALPLTQPVNVADHTWFRRALQTRDFVIGDYQIGRTTGRPGVMLAYPVLDEAGRPRSVIGATLSLDWLGHLLAPGNMEQGGTLTVVDRNGTVLARYPEPEKWVGQSLPEAPLVEAILTQRRGVVETTGMDGVRRLYAFTPLNGTTEPSAYVSVGFPSDAVYASANRITAGNLIGLAIVAVLALQAAWFGSYAFVVRPLGALLGATRRLARGDLSARAGLPHGGSELDQLAQAFDDMAAALQRQQTEALQAEQSLRQSEERYRFLIERIPAITYIAAVDEMSTPLYVSPQVETILGISQADYRAKPDTWYSLVHPDDRERVLAEVRLCQATGEPFLSEYRVQAADGRTVWIRDEALLQRGPDGRPLYLHGVMYDITDIQQAREALHRAHDELEARVQERTADLAEANASLSAEMAERQRVTKERERHFERLGTLVRVSADVVAETTKEGLLQKVVDAARELTGARIGTSGHGYKEGAFRVGVTSRAAGVPRCPEGKVLDIQKGGVYLRLIEGKGPVRLTEEQLRSQPDWWGLPEGHGPLRGLLGTTLYGPSGSAEGLVMVSDKQDGDFTAEDEALLAQLSVVASLGLQHIEARAEAQRRADALAAVFSALADPIVEYDVKGIIVRANPAAVAACGLDPLGLSWETIATTLSIRRADATPFAPDDLPAARALRGETVVGERYLFTNARGQELTMLISAAPVRGGGGVTGAVAAWHDVSERERLLRELEAERANLRSALADVSEANERYNALGELFPYGMWACKPDGEDTHVSRCFLDLVGMTFDEYQESGWTSLLPPEEAVLAAAEWRRCMETGSIFDFEYRVRGKDGRYRATLNRGVPVRDDQGIITSWVGLTLDIDERKRMEEALRQAHDELELRVGERTSELAGANASLQTEVAERLQVEEALRLQTRELARSNAELEQFAYVASHDLQEPLRMVSTYVQLLAQQYHGKLDAEADDCIGFALDGARRMQQMISDLLAYSRIGTHGTEFAPTACDVVVRHSLANLRVAIEESGATITCQPLPVVMADESQMLQLFQNLIANALKFRGEDPPRVSISARQEEGYWHFSVQDNGIGIDPAVAEHIFVIFRRLHSRREYPGSGIGLALCKRSVEFHGGRIWVESELGKGATFHFTIPIRRLGKGEAPADV